MLKAFDATGKIEARGAYNLLNESLATAFGNGLVNKLTMDNVRWEKYYAKPLSFYNNYHIDKASRTIMPWLQDWLKENKTLYDAQFVEKYMAVLEQEFGRELTAPKLLLNELVLVADGKFGGKFRDSVRKALRASSMYTYEGDLSDASVLKSYNENLNLSVLFIVHRDNLNRLRDLKVLSADDFDGLSKYLHGKSGGVYSFKRGVNVPGFVIVADGYDAALGLVDRVAGLKDGFFGGLGE